MRLVESRSLNCWGGDDSEAEKVETDDERRFTEEQGLATWQPEQHVMETAPPARRRSARRKRAEQERIAAEQAEEERMGRGVELLASLRRRRNKCH